jgi:NAD(P)-dependent dehydrogenase (short-subunit alcohol dehydrogenase family)
MTKASFSDLKNKTVIIAGATGLIGRELCKGFVEQESIVILASKNQVKGKKLEKKLRELNKGSSVYCQLDISKEKSVDDLIEAVLERNSKIDVFINCSWPKTKDWMTNVEKVHYQSIKENLINHLGGYFLCTQKMAITMKKQRAGSIINFGSIYGVVGPNFSIYEDTQMTCPPAYPLIKGGIISMTKYFATYFSKDNIRANCISPGGIFDGQDKAFVKKYTKLTPLKRMGEPVDIIGMTLFLASDASAYITGQNLVVDGGWTAW